MYALSKAELGIVLSRRNLLAWFIHASLLYSGFDWLIGLSLIIGLV